MKVDPQIDAWPQPKGPCVWIQIADGKTFEHMEPFIQSLVAGLPRSPIWIVIPEDKLEAARRTYPDHRCLAAPADEHAAFRRAFKTVRPRSVVFVGDRTRIPTRLVTIAKSWDLPVVVAEPRGTKPAASGSGADLDPRDLVSVDSDDIDRGVMEVVGAFARHHRQSEAPNRSIDLGRRDRLLRLAAMQPIINFRSRRIETLDALRDRLDRPETIACIGSGPSAEDPALNELRFDCLFRVNFRWQGRGILDDPDVIFTFRANAYKAAARAIVGARWIVQERLMLARRYPRRIFGPVAEYFTLQRLPLVLNNWPVDFRPSTGTMMVEVAAALRPKRMIIAGLDLYMHPDGAYPGDPRTANSFDYMHDRETEIACLTRILAAFDGEIVVIGDILRDRLAAEGIVPIPRIGDKDP
jgi:hypothetical protein